MLTAATPYELHLKVLPEDIDQLGHVNNVVYLRWVQEAATAHWTSLTTSEEQAALLWVVLRHEIDYKRAAMPNDEIIARTWVGPAERLSFERNTEILRANDRKLLARARTLWCPVNAHTLKPTEPSAEVRQRFSAKETGVRG